MNSQSKTGIVAGDMATSYNNNVSDIDQILEREKTHNKTEVWSKLDKTLKIQKLYTYADKYGFTHEYSAKDIKALKVFFVSALDKGKLQKIKDVVYNKEKQEIQNIPALHFDTNTHNFTLKNIDVKRVSTLKSLTPKRAVSQTALDTIIDTDIGIHFV